MRHRKIKVAAAAAALITGGFVFKTFFPAAPFDTFVTGVIGLAAFFMGANAAQKFAAPKPTADQE